MFRPSMLALLIAGPMHAGEMLTAQQLQALMPGATLSGISNEDYETRWVQTYGPGEKSGTSTGVFGERNYTTSWSIRRDLWCEEWSNRSGCWRLERVDENTLQPYAGQEKLLNVWTIVEHAQD